MLWTDRDFVTIADLISLDAEVQAVANADQDTPMTLDGSNGVIRRGIEEAGDTLMSKLQQFGNGYAMGGHNAAVLNTGRQSVNRSQILISQVVINPLSAGWSPVKRWAAYIVLSVFYRDAANRSLSDRYAAKQHTYETEVRTRYWEALRSLGVPYVGCPLPCPGAAYELIPTGTWADTNVTLVNGAGTITQPVQVYVTWLDGTKTVNNESGPSNAASAALVSSKFLKVDISALTPPNGAQPAATLPMAAVAYGNATGWHVYVSVNGGPVIRQTTVPVDIAQKTYTFTADPVVTGTVMGTGQYPEAYLAIKTGLLNRG